MLGARDEEGGLRSEYVVFGANLRALFLLPYGSRLLLIALAVAIA